MANMPQLTAILDEVFCAETMAHWYEVFSGVHVTFGAVRGPQEVINDPQLRANDIIVPLEGAGGKLTSTISSPLQVHGVAKVPAKRQRSENTTTRFSGSSDSARPKSMVCTKAAPSRLFSKVAKASRFSDVELEAESFQRRQSHQR
jgi:crotonobetainyl-CoA:carnitine CoA-transferase CaiB-like acyl-CoA transferase